VNNSRTQSSNDYDVHLPVMILDVRYEAASFHQSAFVIIVIDVQYTIVRDFMFDGKIVLTETKQRYLEYDLFLATLLDQIGVLRHSESRWGDLQ